MKKERNSTIDTLRFIAIFTVVAQHTNMFDYAYDSFGGEFFLFLKYAVVNIRFAIPFFFLASGYFFGQSLRKGELLSKVVGRYSKRLFVLFASWTVLYIFFPKYWMEHVIEFGFLRAIYWHVLDLGRILVMIFSKPVRLVMTGTEGHLWFLPALILSMLVLTALIARRKEKWILPVAVVLYSIGVGGEICNSLPSTGEFVFRTFWGPFIGTLFFSAGWWFSKQDDYSLKAALWFLVGGVLLLMIENVFLWKFLHLKPEHAHLFGAVPLGIGIFLLALIYPNLGKGTIFPTLGNLTLGVYVLHILIRDGFLVFRPSFHPVVWDVFFPLVVYVVAAGLTLLMKRYKITNSLVN